MNCGATKHT